MDQVPQSSFIPRQSGNMIVQAPRRRHGRLNILSVFALICFFGALMLSVGVFVLKESHVQALENKKSELASKRSFYRQDDIDAIRALDNRMNAAEFLLDGHVSPSILLDILERTTQEEIQYQIFEFARRPSGNVSVSMQGIAPRFNTVARQAQRYADEENLFTRVIFSDLDKPETHFVSFMVNLDIMKSDIAYDAVTPIVEEEFVELTEGDAAEGETTSIPPTEETSPEELPVLDTTPVPLDDSI